MNTHLKIKKKELKELLKSKDGLVARLEELADELQQKTNLIRSEPDDDLRVKHLIRESALGMEVDFLGRLVLDFDFNVYDEQIETLLAEVSCLEDAEAKDKQNHEVEEAQKQRDHEERMAIIAHETARENRLATEAAAKVAATAQEQASQSLDGLLKGLQGNGET